MLQIVADTRTIQNSQDEVFNRKRRFQLAKLLRSTEEILICAQRGDWDSVEELEFARKTEIAACFSGAPYEESPLVAKALTTLIYMNGQITDLVIQAKRDMLVKRLSLVNGKDAVRNYEYLHSSRDAL